MDIGYFRFREENFYAKRVNAMAYSFYGMNLVFFGPKDINFNKNTIKGKYFTPQGWKTREIPLPKIINNMRIRPNGKHSKLYQYLHENSYLLFHDFGDKNKVESLLTENGLIKELIIPSKILNSYSDVIEMTEKYNKILFKPIDGLMGRGIFTIEKQGEIYRFSDSEEVKTLSKIDMLELVNEIKYKYIVQQYVNSVTPKQLPFDIRVHYEKNGRGQWTKAQTFVRVGISNSIVSNIAKGGSIIRVGSFLRTNYGKEKGNELLEKLNNILKGFPKKFEQLYNLNISTIALDLGMHENNFYLFEINSFPGGTFARGEIAMSRAAYTKYLVDNIEEINKDNERIV